MKYDCGCEITWDKVKALKGNFVYHFVTKCEQHSGHDFESANARIAMVAELKKSELGIADAF